MRLHALTVGPLRILMHTVWMHRSLVSGMIMAAPGKPTWSSSKSSQMSVGVCGGWVQLR